MERKNFPTQEVPSNATIEVYTSLNGLEFDNTSQDALSLIRRGIQEFGHLYGESEINEALGDYTMDVPGVFSPSDLSYQRTWEYYRSRKNGQPFLLVSRNSVDGVIGALDGRSYTYTYEIAGLEEAAIFINWVAVSNVASNEGSTYSYRGKHLVGASLYDKVEEIAEQNNVRLLIAGIHSNNVNSRRFHLSRGFSSQPWIAHPEKSHPTPKGAYIKDTPADENDPAKGSIKYYTKRLVY